MYHDHSPRIAPVPTLPNPGGFRLDIFDYGSGTQLPGAASPGTFNNGTLESGIPSYTSGGRPQPGGFVVPDAPASPHNGNNYDNRGPGDLPWIGGFGAYR